MSGPASGSGREWRASRSRRPWRRQSHSPCPTLLAATRQNDETKSRSAADQPKSSPTQRVLSPVEASDASSGLVYLGCVGRVVSICTLGRVTRPLDAVIAKLSELPAQDQDPIARWLLDELRTVKCGRAGSRGRRTF